LFEPLGYAVDVVSYELDPHAPAETHEGEEEKVYYGCSG